jgi:glycosyltransferase involved in cell wall biosynthesis
MKKIAKNIAHHSLVMGRKVISKNPRLKRAIKKSIIPHLRLKNSKDTYSYWLDENFPDFIEIAKLRKEQEAFAYHPLVSIVVPAYNTDISFLHDCIGSVLGQVYENWELIIVDDASPNKMVREVIETYAQDDTRIKYKFLKENVNISSATNEAVQLANGEFIGIFDHDDLLWPNALFEVAKALNADKTIDFLYSDEDKITEDRFEHLGYFFKPDWNPDFLRSVNYFTHFTVVRKSIFEKVGGERGEYNGAQDWDLYLRIVNETQRIHHIPKVLYSWRVHDLSTAKSTDSKPYVIEAQRKALNDDLVRRGISDAIVEQDPVHTGYWNITYPVQGDPLISIVIPSKNQYKIVKRCIESIYDKSTYGNYEIILVDTGSDDDRVWAFYDKIAAQHDNFKVVKWFEKPFSYARSCNEGARHAAGELLLMLNNDTEVIIPDWLQLMAGDAQRKDIGAVGALLFYPDGYNIQHAGVGVGLGGVAANSFQMMTLDQPMSQTQHLMLNTKHDMTVVTAACLMMRKDLFEEIDGFDETYRVTYNDVDLCLRLHSKGYQNLYTPYVRLLHHESISVGLPEELAKRDTKEMQDAMKQFTTQWAKYVKHDPNINPNLDKSNAFYDIPRPSRSDKSDD